MIQGFFSWVGVLLREALCVGFFVYVFSGFADYYAVKHVLNTTTHDTKEFCQRWLHEPWYVELAMPGPGAACLDLGENR